MTKRKNFSRRLIFLNTFYQLSGKVFGLIFVLLSTIILRRYLGREGYGEYVFIYSFVTFFATISDFGTRLVSVAEASKQHKKQDKILSYSLGTRLIWLALSLVLYLAAVAIFPLGFSTKLILLIASGLVVAFWLRDSYYMIFTTRLRLGQQTVIELVVGLLILIGIIFSVWLKKDLTFIYLFIVLAINVYLGGFWLLSKTTKKLKPLFDKKWIVRFLKKGGVVFGTLLVYSASTQLPFLTLKIWHSARDLGIFGLSYRIYENAIIPAALFMNICLPVFGKTNQVSRQKHTRFVQNAFDASIVLSLSVVLGLVLLAPLGIRIITGEFLQPEILATRLLAPVLAVSYLNHFFGFWFLGKGLLKELFTSKLLALLVALPVGLFLIWRYSYFGAIVFDFLVEAITFFYSTYIAFFKIKYYPIVYRFPATLKKIIASKGKVLIYEQ